MANTRWKRVREQQAKIDTLDPVRVGGKIKRRIIVIDEETFTRERAFYEFDRECDWKRKVKEVMEGNRMLRVEG